MVAIATCAKAERRKALTPHQEGSSPHCLLRDTLTIAFSCSGEQTIRSPAGHVEESSPSKDGHKS